MASFHTGYYLQQRSSHHVNPAIPANRVSRLSLISLLFVSCRFPLCANTRPIDRPFEHPHLLCLLPRSFPFSEIPRQFFFLMCSYTANT
jgi:hypothetical protein